MYLKSLINAQEVLLKTFLERDTVEIFLLLKPSKFKIIIETINRL